MTRSFSLVAWVRFFFCLFVFFFFLLSSFIYSLPPTPASLGHPRSPEIASKGTSNGPSGSFGRPCLVSTNHHHHLLHLNPQPRHHHHHHHHLNPTPERPRAEYAQTNGVDGSWTREVSNFFSFFSLFCVFFFIIFATNYPAPPAPPPVFNHDPRGSQTPHGHQTNEGHPSFARAGALCHTISISTPSPLTTPTPSPDDHRRPEKPSEGATNELFVRLPLLGKFLFLSFFSCTY
jgi:hypothetical protein